MPEAAGKPQKRLVIRYPAPLTHEVLQNAWFRP
jgi:hypothetical protein